MTDGLLSLSHLSVGYSAEHPIIKDVSATLSRGECCILLGRNGTGKSTLLRTLAGLLRPLSGEIVRPELIGVVLTAFPSLPYATCLEVTAWGRLQYTSYFGRLSTRDYDLAAESLATVGLPSSCFTQRFSTLSDGQRQKVMIARALTTQAPLLLLDEPTAFLDYPSRQELFALLSRLASSQHLALLLSTHDIDMALPVAHRCWLLSHHTLHSLSPASFSPSLLFQE